jgi:hypothetical protein
MLAFFGQRRQIIEATKAGWFCPSAEVAVNTDATIQTDDADHSGRIDGHGYTGFLACVHAALKPVNYLEIGTARGGTLALANCASIAIDPGFRIDSNVVGKKPLCLLFQLTSDDFFKTHSPTALFGRSIDMAFLDGMHQFEFLLRDFINTEKHCNRNSVVFMHDCLPPGFYMTVRNADDPERAKSRFPDWWTGDVWRVLPVLRRYRPDLSVTLLDCVPTGLVAITNLDPSNTTLADNYKAIMAAFKPDLDRAAYDAFWKDLDITAAADLSSPDKIKSALGR